MINVLFLFTSGNNTIIIFSHSDKKKKNIHWHPVKQNRCGQVSRLTLHFFLKDVHEQLITISVKMKY